MPAPKWGKSRQEDIDAVIKAGEKVARTRDTPANRAARQEAAKAAETHKQHVREDGKKQ